MLIYSIDDLPHGGRETGNEQRYRGRRVHCCQPGRDSGRGADRPRLLTGPVTWRRRRTMSIWEDSVFSLVVALYNVGVFKVIAVAFG